MAGFLFGVIKKYGDDRGSMLAAIITFYGLLSLFPLLLLATTVMAFAFGRGAGVQSHIQNSVLGEFPALVVGNLKGSGIALVIGGVGLLWGSLGVAQAVQFAMAEAWDVPNVKRPGFVPRLVRSFGFLVLLSATVVGTTALTALGAIVGNSMVAGAIGLIGALAVNIGVFWAIFRLMSPPDVSAKALLPGAVMGGVGWQILQLVGQTLVRHNLKNLSPLYGQFAVVLGLISFLSLASQLMMYSVELNVVLARRLWPRSILQPPRLEADNRALEDQAAQEVRVPGQEIDVRLPAS